MAYKQVSFTIPKCYYSKEDKQYHPLTVIITLYPRKRHYGLFYGVLGVVWENDTRTVIKRIIEDCSGITDGIKEEKRQLLKHCKKVFNLDLSFITRKKSLCYLLDYYKTHKKMRDIFIP